MYQLLWEDGFHPYYGGGIHIPKGLIMYRGYETNNVPVLDRPCFYGSERTAKGYADKPNRRLGTFCATKDLYLLDIRYLCVLLRQLFVNNPTVSFTKDEEACILASSISLGLCSLSHQIKLMNYAYKNVFDKHPGFFEMKRICNSNLLIEQPGVRVAETNIDGKTTAFLKELLRDVCDGFIAPRLFSQFHHEKQNSNSPELLIFDSQKSQIQLVDLSPQRNYPFINVNEMIQKFHSIVTIEKPLPVSTTFFMNGGGSASSTNLPPLEEFNARLTMNDPDARKAYQAGERAGKRWRLKRPAIVQIEAPSPNIASAIYRFGNTIGDDT